MHSEGRGQVGTAFTVVYADNVSFKDLEIECLKPDPSSVLSDIGLALLKYVSSHRGLT